MKRQKSDYIVQSVIKALEVMETLVEGDEELGVGELGLRLGIQKNGVVRIVHTLEQRGYLEQNADTGNYRIGLKAFEIGQAFRHQLGLFQAARPILRDIVQRVDESVSIAVLRGHNVVYLDVVLTSKPLRLASRVGSITPAFCTAVGKVQLAFLPPAQFEALVPRIRFAPLTEHTITDPDRLRLELAEVARLGYALDNQEFEPGVRCIGVPVRDHHRRVVAGITLSAPLSRMSDERIRSELLPLLMEAGSDISRRLGYDPGRGSVPGV